MPDIIIYNSLEALEEQYSTLRRNLPDIFANCRNEIQKQQARTSYLQSQQNYFGAIYLLFDHNDAHVAKLTKDLKNAQKEIDDSLNNLKDIAKVLQVITQGVMIGTSLVKLVAV